MSIFDTNKGMPDEGWPRYPDLVNPDIIRYKVPGGWLIGAIVRVMQPSDNISGFEEKIINQGLTFFPDPDHSWQKLADYPEPKEDEGNTKGKILKI